MASSRVVSSHLPPSKDRALTVALLRVSDKVIRHDDVIYCGPNEPIYGWTATVPNPRYSEKPKPSFGKKKKILKKMKASIDYFKNSEAILEMSNASSNTEGQYHTYATLRDMYDTYKKTRLQMSDQRNDIIDPVTYKYIPWSEREEDESIFSDDIKLPMLKMSHPAKSSKLVEVLEKYMHRGNPIRSPETGEAITTRDSDRKYRWDFDKKKKTTRKSKGGLKQAENGVSKNEPLSKIDPSAKEKLVRYVNGAVKKKKHHNTEKSYYVTLHPKNRDVREVRDDSDVISRMIKFEKTKEDERWVARVIIGKSEREHVTSSDTTSSIGSSVVIVPSTRYKKLGVVGSERERIKRRIQARRRNRNEESYENGSDDTKKQYRFNSQQSSAEVPPVFAVVETAKVTMKYDVETARRKGTVHVEDDLSPRPSITEVTSQSTKKKSKAKSDVISILPKPKTQGPSHRETALQLPPVIGSGSASLLKVPEIDPSILHRGRRNDLLPSIQEASTMTNLPDLGRKSRTSSAFKVNDTTSSNNGEVTSSTFNSDEMVRQLVETANFISTEKSSDFLRYKVIPNPGSSNTDRVIPRDKKPLHPPHVKNRSRKKLQNLVDEQQTLVNSVIQRLNQQLQPSDGILEESSFKNALSTAIAKARLLGEKSSQQPPTNLTTGNVVMKRRVVPPIITTKPPEGSIPSNVPVGPAHLLNSALQAGIVRDIPAKVAKREKRTKLRKLPKRQASAAIEDTSLPDVICSGDVIIQDRPTPKLLESNFAASITSVKPTRRVANFVRNDVMQPV
ncbi:uncharacterized protein LOC100185776 [Ciona intestinalis]